MKTLFVTATDTDAGKTFVAAALTSRLAAAGQKVAVYKPLAAGAEYSGESGQLVNDDALALLAESNTGQTYAQVNPYCFEPPIAPHIASAEAGETISLSRIIATAQDNAQGVDWLLCEGAGGWLVPIDDQQDMSAIALGIQAEVVLVVGMKLGCINHALLTARLIQQSGLVLRGWVANTPGETMSRYAENLAYLRAHIPAPLLAELPFSPQATASDIGKLFDLELLYRD